MDKNTKKNWMEIKKEADKIPFEEIEGSKINEEKIEASIEEVALLLKNNKIDQIIVAGERHQKKDSKEKILTLKPDLDASTALYILNNFNKKSEAETYNEGSMTSIIEKNGEGKNLIEDKNGIKIFLDVSGNWLEVEKGGETTTIYIDHHGAGKRAPTSGTKMMTEIMKKANILKEKPEWLNKFISFVNDIDNLSYLDKKDNKNRKVFNENYFRNEWPNSLYALAEKQIPFEQLIELCKSEMIKDPSVPFTTEEINGEIGNTKIGDVTIKELCAQQKEQVEQVLDGIKNSITNNKKEGLNLETESLGKIIYQDYFKIRGKVNMIPDHLAFKATKAKGFDTYVSWNKQKDSFFINSSNPNLSKVVEELNTVDPECAKDVRGVMVFGKIKNLTEEQFLNTIDPKILEDKKIKEKNNEWTEEDEKTLNDLLNTIEETKKELSELDKLEAELNHKNEIKIVNIDDAILKIETDRTNELENPNITINDYISCAGFTDAGEKYAREDTTGKYLEEGKKHAVLSFKYLQNKISARDLIHTEPYRYVRENIDDEEAIKYANRESSLWKPFFDKINAKYDKYIEELKK